MTYANGRIPDSDLFEVPGGRLEKEAAANWLALRRRGGNELGIWISPLGPRSSYRTFAEQQEFWTLYQSGRGALAAKPGTSNHGWGRAVDLALPIPMRRVVDGFGAPFGWHWGEAPSENWHVTYRGGGQAGDDEFGKIEQRSLKQGDTGEDVRKVQQWMADHGYVVAVDGDYGPATAACVKKLYANWGHEPHGRFGDVGWSIIEDKHPWRFLTDQERGMLADLYAERRKAKKAGGWDKLDESRRRHREACRAWLIARRQELWTAGNEQGWKSKNRRRRYEILNRQTT
jgi:D-alanyl-D-alanine carboxypeptidase